MPRLQQLAPLLRPLAAPRAMVCRQHFRFSTATRLCADNPVKSSKPSAPSQAPPAPPTTPQEASRAADLAAAEAVTESDSAQPPEPKPKLPSDHSTETTPSTTSKKADNVPTPPAPPASKPNTESSLKEQAAPTTSTRKADDIFPPSTPTPHSNTESALKKAPKSKTASAISIELPPPRYHVSRSANKNLPIYTDYKRGGNLHLTTVRKITGDLSALRDELRVYLNKKNEDVKINSLTGHVIIKGHHTGQVKTFLEARGM